MAGDDKRAGRRPTPPKSVSDFLASLPVAVTTASTEPGDAGRRKKERALSERDEPPPPWSDCSLPAKSVSMIDMRGEDEGILQPHSPARHELMHNQYNRMKEEEDHWQDDLARWKNRRRSISQDLIKKEEERKMMEQLMSGGGSCVSQRRRSIKTYREIVEDKERREEELRLAYRGAGTPEEASAILQRYAQRFSISEAVLERLQLPKLLDRSVSADPAFPLSLPLSAPPTTPDPFDPDPDGPLRYLRQQSAPPPKFTSTLEARVEEFPRDSPPPPSHHRPQIRSRSSEPPSTRNLSPKPVPLLTPKPYLARPPAAAATEAWSSKADSLLRVNGDVGSDDVPVTPESPGRESPPFQASKSSSPSPAVLPPAGPAGPASTKAEETQRGTSAASEEEEEKSSSPRTRPTSLPAELQKHEESFVKSGAHPAASAEQRQTEPRSEKLVQSGVDARQRQGSVSCPDQTRPTAAAAAATPPNSSAASSAEFHPNTENPEQDRRGNEKYEREQEKLREEWEKAQREVAEEERKFHEEERRILEETVAPLTPRSSSALPSPSRAQLSTSEPHGAVVRSLADWERKQELLEKQSRGSEESVESLEWKRRENDRTSDISTADDSMKTGRSLMSVSSSQAEAAAHSSHNGQKLPAASSKTSSPVKKQQEVSGDGNKPGRPPGERRSGSSDHNVSRRPAAETPAPNRSVSGKKLCSSCGQPLGKGAAMIIETLSLFFHIHCFKCGVCKGQLGDTTTGTDVRIRNGLLNCHQCYIRSRSAGQPTTL